MSNVSFQQRDYGKPEYSTLKSTDYENVMLMSIVCLMGLLVKKKKKQQKSSVLIKVKEVYFVFVC